MDKIFREKRTERYFYGKIYRAMGVFKKGNNWYVDYYLKGIRKRKKIALPKAGRTGIEGYSGKDSQNEYLGVLEEKKVLFKDFARIYLDYSRTNKAVSSFKRIPLV